MMTENSTISISFIIPVLNGGKYIGRCLDRVLAEKSPADEIIVVDNGSTDDTITVIRSYDGVRLLQYTELTIAASRNRGASASKKNTIAFIDADCVVGGYWRRNVVAVLRDDSIAATGSRCAVPETGTWLENAWYSQKLKTSQPVNYINSGNLIVRRQAFNVVGGFNESLVSDEDCDLGLRLNSADLLVLEAPQIRTVHLGNPKTLTAFFKQQLWRATSSLASQTWRRVDKPTLMAGMFLVSLILAAVAIPLSLIGGIGYLWLSALLPVVLLVTSLYRVVQYRRPRYLLELHVLFFVFFLARSVVLVRTMLSTSRSRAT